MELWGVLKCHAGEKDVFAIVDAEDIVALLFLFFGGVSDVGIAGFQFPRIPQRAVLTFDSTHVLEPSPFDVAYFHAFYWTPLGAVSVYRAIAGYGDVPDTLCADAGADSAGFRIGVDIQLFVWREVDDRVAFEMKADVAFQFERPCQPDSLREYDVTAAIGRQSVDGSLDGFCREGDSVAFCTEVSDVDSP